MRGEDGKGKVDISRNKGLGEMDAPRAVGDDNEPRKRVFSSAWS